jgi:hypothetical protein
MYIPRTIQHVWCDDESDKSVRFNNCFAYYLYIYIYIICTILCYLVRYYITIILQYIIIHKNRISLSILFNFEYKIYIHYERLHVLTHFLSPDWLASFSSRSYHQSLSHSSVVLNISCSGHMQGVDTARKGVSVPRCMLFLFSALCSCCKSTPCTS